MTNSVERIVAAERKILTFTLGDQVFGIDMAPLIEIREWDEPTPLPQIPAYICGVMNLRGAVVPIVDLASRIGSAPTHPQARSCIVVFDLQDQAAGFLVNQVADIVPVAEQDIQPAPDVEMGEPGAVTGLVNAVETARQGATQMITLLDLSALNVTSGLQLAA
jgi:purine-binding chemotaxis protein CheW